MNLTSLCAAGFRSDECATKASGEGDGNSRSYLLQSACGQSDDVRSATSEAEQIVVEERRGFRRLMLQQSTEERHILGGGDNFKFFCAKLQIGNSFLQLPLFKVHLFNASCLSIKTKFTFLKGDGVIGSPLI